MPRNPETTTDHGNGTATPEPRLKHLERRLIEAFDELWDSFVDPADAIYDADGTRWLKLGGEGAAGGTLGAGIADETQLAEVRAQCRALAVSNEFAINGHERHVTKAPFRHATATPRG